MKFLRLILLFVCFFYKLEGVCCIRCYQCSSDPENLDYCGAYGAFPKEKHIAVDCNSEESKLPGTFCMKFTQQGPRGFIWDGRWRQVIRQCASVAENGVTGVCNWGVLPNGVYWEKCYCSEDGCNSSVKFNSSYKLFVFLFIVLYTFWS